MDHWVLLTTIVLVALAVDVVSSIVFFILRFDFMKCVRYLKFYWWFWKESYYFLGAMKFAESIPLCILKAHIFAMDMLKVEKKYDVVVKGFELKDLNRKWFKKEE